MNALSFPFCLWKDSGFVTCTEAAQGGLQPSRRFCLWGGHGFPWGSSWDVLMKLAVLLLPWLAKSALCTLAWQCWSVVHFPKSHTPKLWSVWAVNWSQVPGPWGGSFLSFVVSLVFTVQDWASSGSLLLIPLIHSEAKDCENNSK